MKSQAINRRLLFGFALTAVFVLMPSLVAAQEKVVFQSQRDGNPGADEDAIRDDVRATLLRLRDLRLPHRHCSHVPSCADPEDHPGDNELGEPERGRHEDCADYRHGRGEEDHFPAAEEVAQIDARQGAEDAADGV